MKVNPVKIGTGQFHAYDEHGQETAESKALRGGPGPTKKKKPSTKSEGINKQDPTCET